MVVLTAIPFALFVRASKNTVHKAVRLKTLSKYVKHLTNDELLERMADDFVQMHNETAIDLGYWETAREVVERFYDVQVHLIIRDRRNK